MLLFPSSGPVIDVLSFGFLHSAGDYRTHSRRTILPAEQVRGLLPEHARRNGHSRVSERDSARWCVRVADAELRLGPYIDIDWLLQERRSMCRRSGERRVRQWSF